MYEDGRLRMVPVCHEPDTADCRVVPRNGCRCDQWTLDRADDGTPFHRVDTFGGAEVLHWMDTGGPCIISEWWEDPEECGPPTGSHLLTELPVTPQWEPDGGYTWTPATPTRAPRKLGTRRTPKRGT